MDTTIIIALIATFSAIITAIISNSLSKRNTLKFEERKLKEQYYLEFIHALSENMNTTNTEEATIRYNHAFNNLVVIANSKVLSALYEFSDLLIGHIKHNNIEDYDNQYTRKLTNLVKEMRADLYGVNSKKVNQKLPDIYLISDVLKSNANE